MMNTQQHGKSLVDKPKSLMAQSTSYKTVSQFKDVYLAWVANVEAEAVKALTIGPSVCSQAHVRYSSTDITTSHNEQADVQMMLIERNGAVVTYQVTISAWAVDLKMLNIDATLQWRRQGTLLQSGNFGEVYFQQGVDGHFASKRIPFAQQVKLLHEKNHNIEWNISANFSQLRFILVEIAFAKLCAVFGIGAPIKQPFGFDVLCFRDHVEYFMEKCHPVETFPRIREIGYVQRRLKYCMRLMHLLKIVHRDIKPPNILYSPETDELVFCDFGIARVVANDVGYKTLTEFAGTMCFMSEQMQQLARLGQEREVDLYYNDMHCLAITLQRLAQSNQPNRPRATEWTNYKAAKSELSLQSLMKSVFEIYCTGKATSLPDNDHPYRKVLIKYFPQLEPENSFKPLSHINVDFLVSSVPLFDGEFQYYLQQCDTNDIRVTALVNRFNFSKNRPEGAKNTELVASLYGREFYRRKRMLQRDLRVLLNNRQTTDVEGQIGRVAVELFQQWMTSEIDSFYDLYKDECERLLEVMRSVRVPKEQSELTQSFEVCELQYELAFVDSQSPRILKAIEDNCARWSLVQLRIFAELMRSFPTELSEQVFMMVLERMAKLVSGKNAAEFDYIHSVVGQQKQRRGGIQQRLSYFSELVERFDAETQPTEWCLSVSLLADEERNYHFQKAVHLLKTSLLYTARPLKHKLLLKLARILESAQRYEEALTYYSQAAELTRQFEGESLQFVIAKRHVGLVMSLVGDIDEGIRTLTWVVEKMRAVVGESDPLTVAFQFDLIRSYSKKKWYDLALSKLEDLRRKIPQTGPLRLPWMSWHMALIEVSWQHLESRPDIAQQRMLAQKLVPTILEFIDKTRNFCAGKKNKNLASFYTLVSGYFMFLERYEQAKMVLLLAQELAVAYFAVRDLPDYLCICQTHLGMHTEARGRFDRSRNNEVLPKPPQVSNSLYLRERCMKLLSEASMAQTLSLEVEAHRIISELKEVMADPQSTLAANTKKFKVLAKQYFNRGWHALSLQIFEIQQRLHPSSEVEYYIAQCLYELKQCHKCMERTVRLSEPMQQQQVYVDYWLLSEICNLSGRACQVIGDADGSKNYLEQEAEALRLLTEKDKRHIKGLHRLAAIYDQQKKTHASLGCIRRAFAVAVRSNIITDQLCLDCSLINIRCRHPQKALSNLTHCSTTNEQALFYKARCSLNVKRYRKFYQAALFLKTVYKDRLREHLLKTKRKIQLVILFNITVGQQVLPSCQRQQLASTILQKRRLRARKYVLHATNPNL